VRFPSSPKIALLFGKPRWSGSGASSGNRSRWSNSSGSSGSGSSDSKPSGILKVSKYSGSDKKARPPNPQGTNGLTPEQSERLTGLIKEKLATMPDFEESPDYKIYSIDMDGQTVAIFCKKCKHFTCGTKEHSTVEHTGPQNSSSRGKSMMSQASSYLASSTTTSCPPVSTVDQVCVPIQPPVSYDFSPLTRAGAFYSSTSVPSAPCPPSASLPADSDDESAASVDHHLLAALGYPIDCVRQG
jgi:hypothetical protein